MFIFEEAIKCGDVLKQRTQERSINGKYEQVLALFLEGSVRTLKAINVLYDTEFYEEGFSLIRILLEVGVDLEYINLDKVKLAEQYFEFANLKSNKQADRLKDLNVPLSSEERYSINLQFKNDLKWSQKTFGEMLEKILLNKKTEKDWFIVTYKFLCDFSHPSALGLGATVAFTKEEITVKARYRENLKEALPVLSCHLAMGIFLIINEEFHLSTSPQIKQIMAEIGKLAGK